jgi:hypothetical protein
MTNLFPRPGMFGSGRFGSRVAHLSRQRRTAYRHECSGAEVARSKALIHGKLGSHAREGSFTHRRVTEKVGSDEPVGPF